MTTAWHERQATHKHFQWFRNLQDLHELTTTWIKEAEVDRSPHEMERGLYRDVAENLWMLDAFPKADLDSLMDDTSPDDVLGRLERTVWAVQAGTLSFLLERTSQAGEKRILESVLEQIAWKLGRRAAESRWGAVSQDVRANLKELVLTLWQTPFANYPKGEGFLIKRATSQMVDFEFLACPHRYHYPEIRAVADDLCRIHKQWILGFGYGLNPAIKIENIDQPRCGQTWRLEVKN